MSSSSKVVEDTEVTPSSCDKRENNKEKDKRENISLKYALQIATQGKAYFSLVDTTEALDIMCNAK